MKMITWIAVVMMCSDLSHGQITGLTGAESAYATSCSQYVLVCKRQLETALANKDTTMALALETHIKYFDGEVSRMQKRAILVRQQQDQQRQFAIQQEQIAAAKKQQEEFERNSILLTAIGADQLRAMYDDNEIAADRDFKGRWVLVTGRVESVSRDMMNISYVTLKTSEFTGVQAYFSREYEQQLMNLSRGQMVSIAGQCGGKFMNVLLKGCTVVAPTRIGGQMRIQIVSGE